MCNLGKIDRIIRVTVALILLTAGFTTPYWWLAIIGVVALVTSAMSFCPLYALLGLNSGCEIKNP